MSLEAITALVNAILQQAAANGDNDRGYLEVGEEVHGPGPFEIPQGCDRNSATASTGVWADGDSTVLRANLYAAGCGCVEGGVNIRDSQAHHIVPKGGSSPSLELTQLHNCSSQRGVKVDSAWNGVCLPAYNGSDPNLPTGMYTDAFYHRGRITNLHGGGMVQKLLDICENTPAYTDQWKNTLAIIGDRMTRGQRIFDGLE